IPSKPKFISIPEGLEQSSIHEFRSTMVMISFVCVTNAGFSKLFSCSLHLKAIHTQLGYGMTVTLSINNYCKFLQQAQGHRLRIIFDRLIIVLKKIMRHPPDLFIMHERN
ncbi:uncharacterized protein B0P05DRAFT_476228, partial [Gilbertella persicaria]